MPSPSSPTSSFSDIFKPFEGTVKYEERTFVFCFEEITRVSLKAYFDGSIRFKMLDLKMYPCALRRSQRHRIRSER